MKIACRTVLTACLLVTTGRAADFALKLDGTNDFVTFGAAPELGATNFTVELWFQRHGTGIVTSTGTGGITNSVPLLTKGRGQAEVSNLDMNYHLGIRQQDRTIAADFEEGAAGTAPALNHPVFSSSSINETTFWHHAAVTYDLTNLTLYLDGLMVGQLATNQPPRGDSIQHAALGTAMTSAGVPAGFFNGLVDEPRIWNYARTEEEIRAGMRVAYTNTPAGLIGRWGLDEGSGATVTNSVPGGSSGAISNDAVWVAGYPFTYAGTGGLLFDGVNDFVTFGRTNALGVSNFTIEVWFYRTATGTLTSTGSGGISNAIPLLAKGGAQNEGTPTNMNYMLGIRMSDNMLVADFESMNSTPVGQNFPIAGVTPIVSNTWNHAAATYDGTNWSLYLNGELEITAPATNAANGPGQIPEFVSIQHASLGTTLTAAGTPSGFFAGILDEARVWNYVRSATEIAYYRHARIATAPGLVSRWSLDEERGYTASNTANDQVTGTLSNGPIWAAGNPFATNIQPLAADDAQNTFEDFSVVINLLANDIDADSNLDSNSVVVISTPANGSVTTGGVGLVLYTPDTNFFGTNSFEYQVCDLDGLCDTGLVTVSVIAVNDAPLAGDDAQNTFEDFAVLINVLTNDSDVEGTLDSNSVVVISTPANGSVTTGVVGLVLYTPDTNFFGTNSFEYQVCDLDGLCDTGLVTVSVIAVNDAPLAGDDAQNTFEDFSVLINVLTNDSDVEGTLDSNSVVVISTPANGSVTTGGVGLVLYTPNTNFFGTNTFEYQVCDLGGLCDTGLVTVAVLAVNDAPIAGDDAQNTFEDFAVLINVLTNDSDVEGTLDSNSVVVISTPANGSVTTGGVGLVLYTPDTNFFGTNSFEYQVCDLGGLCDTGLVTVTVTEAVPVADIGLGLSDSPDPVSGSGLLVYTLFVTNHGPDAAAQVTLTNILPAGVTPTGTIVTNLPGLAAGVSTSITIQVSVNTSTVGVITNTAQASSTAIDPDISNNSAQETTAIQDTDGDGNPDFNDNDDDNDGMPDDFEVANGLDPANATDAQTDSDGDTFSNLQEYIADTLPTNGTSYLRISVIAGADPLSITFPSSTSRLYGLEYSTDLLQSAWTPIQTNIPGLSPDTTITDPNPDPVRHYRIGAGLP